MEVKPLGAPRPSTPAGFLLTMGAVGMETPAQASFAGSDILFRPNLQEMLPFLRGSVGFILFSGFLFFPLPVPTEPV